MDTSSAPIVFFDLDGVVADSFPAFETWVLEHFGIKFTESFNLADLPGDVFEFFEKPELQDFRLRTGARENLWALKNEGWEIVYCTVRHERIRLATLTWFAKKKLPVDGILFSSPQGGTSKLNRAGANGALVLVEDEKRHLIRLEHPEVARVLLQTNSAFVAKKNARAAADPSADAPHIFSAPDWFSVRETLRELALSKGFSLQKQEDTFRRLHS